MILVRDEFRCKPGKTGPFVEAFKEMGQMVGEESVIKSARILTDISGSFDTIVVESEIESIDAYRAMLLAMFADPERQARQEEREEAPYVSGKRTFYTIEASF